MTEEDKEFINYYIAQYLSEDIAIEDDFKFVDAIKRVVARLKDLEAIDQVHKEQNGELQKKVTELEEEKRELVEYLVTQNCEINRLNLDKIRLEMSQLPDTSDTYKYLKNEYKTRLERTNLENYKSNYIPKAKVKAKIEELKEKIEFYKKHANTTRDRVESRLMCDQIEELKTAIKYLEELLQE